MSGPENIHFGRLPYAVVDSGAVATLTGAEAKTYLVIAAHASVQYASHPGVARLCEKTGLKRRTIQKAIRGLQAKKLLAIETGGGRGGTNHYRLLVNGAPVCALSNGRTPKTPKGARGRLETAHGHANNSAPPFAPTEGNRERISGARSAQAPPQAPGDVSAAESARLSRAELLARFNGLPKETRDYWRGKVNEGKFAMTGTPLDLVAADLAFAADPERQGESAAKDENILAIKTSKG